MGAKLADTLARALPPFALNESKPAKPDGGALVRSSCTFAVAELPGARRATTGTGIRLGSRPRRFGVVPVVCGNVTLSRRTSFASPRPVFVICRVTLLLVDVPERPT